MTIKAQAFLQGYLHEKEAVDPKVVPRAVKPRAVKPWATPLVEAPGIPQAPPDPGVKKLFPDGKATHTATQLKMPETSRERLIREGQAEAKRHRNAGTTPKQNEWNEGFRRRKYPMFDWEGSLLGSFPLNDSYRWEPTWISRARDQERRRSQLGDWSFTPGSLSDQHLQNLKDREGNPVSAADFVAMQRKNFEKDRPSLLSRLNPWKVHPKEDLISYDKRNQPVTLDTWRIKNVRGPAAHPWESSIVGLDPEKLRENPKGEWIPEKEEWANQWRDYHGYPETSDGRSAARYDDGVPVLNHEGIHNYTGGDSSGDPAYGEAEYLPGTSYITNHAAEYTQGVTSGLNAMRDITGQLLNDPQQVHQLFDEIVAKPSILDSIASEPARVFRTYLTLRKTNPKLAEKLRNSIAFNSQYLAENEPAQDPMVQKDVARV